MRLVGILTVRNEADIIGQSLRHNASLLDAILVVDNGSNDGSVEEIQKVSSEYPHVVLVRVFDGLVAEQVRCHLWNCFRSRLRNDDWWVIIDGDEFLEAAVASKIRQATKEKADHIFSWHANFYYKNSERQDWLAGRETLSDRRRPIEARRRWYQMHTSMPRAFRNLPYLRWNRETATPEFLSTPARLPIVFRHYQYRDLPQIEQRIATRRKISVPPEFLKENPHWVKDSIEQAISCDDDPNLLYWDLQSELQLGLKMPAIPVQPEWKRQLKRGRSVVKALYTRHQPLTRFEPLDSLKLVFRNQDGD